MLEDMCSQINYLPAFGVLPIKIKSIKVVPFDKCDDIFNESSPASRVVHHPGIFASKRIIPSTNGNQNLDSFFFQGNDLLIEMVVNISPPLEEKKKNI